ncbi:unnamed protein product [Phyllotreta striolata]|uniref:Uncharacterized protein n=1 Tax=Phyllotreta striolata TaxID=444603 RepID=A0A9N9XKQ1_PHYSR|nr:unnamed protein product [Phyllotreta striolata]
MTGTHGILEMLIVDLKKKKIDTCVILVAYKLISLGVEDGILQAYNQDFELQFSHRVSLMTRFSQADMDACTFLYLLKDDHDNLLYCYLFVAKTPSDVSK